MDRHWRNRVGAFAGGVTGIIVFALLPLSMTWRFAGCGLGCIAGVITGFYADKIFAALWKERARTYSAVTTTQQAMRSRLATIRQKVSEKFTSALQWKPVEDEITDIKRLSVGIAKLAFVVGAVVLIIWTIIAYETNALTAIHYLFIACFAMTWVVIAIHGLHLLVDWIRDDVRRQRTIVLWAAMGTWAICWSALCTAIGVVSLFLLDADGIYTLFICVIAVLVTFLAPWTVVHDMEWSKKNHRVLYAQPNGALRLYAATLWDTARIVAWWVLAVALLTCGVIGVIFLWAIPIILPFCFIIFMGRAIQKMVERSVLLCLFVTLIVTMMLAWHWHPTDVVLGTWLAAFAAGALSGIMTELICRGVAFLCNVPRVQAFFTKPIEPRLIVISEQSVIPLFNGFSRIATALIFSFGNDIQEELGTR